jgi:putative dimethyl sulfoxide reductase chaperone
MLPIRIEPKRTLCLDALKTLCRIFWGPDLELCQDIINGKITNLLQAVSAAFSTDLDADIKETARLAGQYKDAESLCAALSDGYISLFVNDIKGIPAPLYHSCYLTSDSRLMGPSAIDIKNRIEHHGLTISLPGNEPADHLSIELEYLYYLLNMGWSEPSAKHIREAVHFSADSMYDWVCRLYERIISDGRFPFYAIAAHLLCSIVRILAQPADFIQMESFDGMKTI